MAVYGREVSVKVREMIFDLALAGLSKDEAPIVGLLEKLPPSHAIWGFAGYSVTMGVIGGGELGILGSAGTRNVVVGAQSAMCWCQQASFASYAVDAGLASSMALSSLGGITASDLRLSTDPLVVVVADDKSPIVATDMDDNEVSMWIVALGFMDVPPWGEGLARLINDLISMRARGAGQDEIRIVARRRGKKILRDLALAKKDDDGRRMIYVSVTGDGVSMSFNGYVVDGTPLGDLERKILESEDLGNVDARAVAAAFRLAVGVSMITSKAGEGRARVPKLPRKIARKVGADRNAGPHDLPMFDLRNIVDFRAADKERVVLAAQDECRTGKRKRHGKVTRHLVRGHWRMQPCGPGRKLRRPTWISAHFRGGEGVPKSKIYKLEGSDRE